jgi:hypothetical protein
MKKLRSFPRTLKSLIAFYKSIPTKHWTVGEYFGSGGRCCAVGHLAVVLDMQVLSIERRLRDFEFEVALQAVNDGDAPYQKLGVTPKARVLRYLKSQLKKKGAAK